MTAAQVNKLKRELVDWVKELDADMLYMLDGIRQARHATAQWNKLTEPEKEDIRRGIADDDAGRVMSSAAFWKSLKNAPRKKASR